MLQTDGRTANILMAIPRYARLVRASRGKEVPNVTSWQA